MNDQINLNWVKRLVWALPLVVTVLMPGVGAVVALVITLVALYVFKEARKPVLSFVHRSWAFCIFWGVVAGLGIHIAFTWGIDPMLAMLTGSNIDLSAYDSVKGNIAAFASLLAVGILFGGVIEEFIYRGFIIGWGSQLFGSRSSPLLVIVSGSIFGIAHLYQGLTGVISTGLIGMCFGFLYLAFNKKLLPAMVAHMVVNILGVTSLYLGI